MAADLPPQVQEQIQRFQQTQQQLQQIVNQRQQIEMQVRELERTLEALEDVGDDTPLYRSVGNLLVGVDDQAELRSELSDQKETLEVRLKSTKRQEDEARKRLEKLQETLEGLLSGAAGGGAAGMPGGQGGGVS